MFCNRVNGKSGILSSQVHPHKSLVILIALLLIVFTGCSSRCHKSSGTEPVWSDISREHLFPPSNPPADTVYVLDIFDESREDAMLACTAQGVINKETPQLYVCTKKAVETAAENERLDVNHQKMWLEWLLKQGYIKNTAEIKNIPEMLKKYNITKAIVIDPELPASLNVGTMIASFKLMPVVYPESIEKYGLEIGLDLRGRWKTNVEAYKWAWEELWPEMDHTTIAWYGSLKDLSRLRDYLIAKKIFTLWVTGPLTKNPEKSENEKEKAYIHEIMKKMPVNIPVMGFPWHGEGVGVGEHTGVEIMTTTGKFHTCNNWKGNLSLWTGLKAKKSQYKQLPGRDIELENDKVYVTMLMSDGDNLNTWIDYFYPYWENTNHGKIPIAWAMGPGLIDMQPPLVDFYIGNIKQTDSIGCAVSGLGYIYPSQFGKDFAPRYRQRIWNGFQELTGRYMKRLDMSWVHIFRKAEPADAELDKYAAIPAMKTIYCDYGGRLEYPDTHYLIDDVVVFHALKGTGQRGKTLANIRKYLPKERPAFLYVFLSNWAWSYDQIKGHLVDNFPDDFVMTRPDEMSELYKQWQSKKLNLKLK